MSKTRLSNARPAIRRDIPSVIVVMTLASGVGLARTAASADWPQWRGPGRNGLVERSPELVNQFRGDAPLWRSDEIPSGERGGRGSLVVADGRVYGVTASSSKDKGVTEVFCLDAERGTSIWRSPLDDPKAPSTSSSTPCVVGDRLFVVSADHRVHCLRSEDGSPMWSTPLPHAKATPIASSIAVVDGVAVLLGAMLVGLDAQTGEILWRQKKVVGDESSPAVWQSPNGSRLICNSRLETHCVVPATGDVLWSVPGGGRSTPTVAQEYGGDFLVNMSGSRRSGLSAYRLTEEGPKKLWTLRAFDRASSPVVFDGHVYAIAGGSNGHGARLLCVHVDTGTIAWDETVDFAEVSSPIVADGKLVAVCGRQVWFLEATPSRFGVLSQANLRMTLCTSPALTDGRMYLRQSGAVLCYDLRLH